MSGTTNGAFVLTNTMLQVDCQQETTLGLCMCTENTENTIELKHVKLNIKYHIILHF